MLYWQLDHIRLLGRMEACRINISGILGCRNIHNFILAVQPVIGLIDSSVPFHLEMDLRYLGFVYPTGTAALAGFALFLQRHSSCQSVKVDRPLNSDVDSYLARMDLYRLLNFPERYQWQRHDAKGRFRELVEIGPADSSETVVTQLVEILEQQINLLSSDTKNALLIALGEMIDNVLYHAQSPVNAIVCAQAYPRQRQLELAIVDCGRGFRQSLMDNPDLRRRFTTADEAIQLAVQMEITSNPAGNNGYGLYVTSELVKANDGEMSICSETGKYEIRQGIEYSEQMCYDGDILKWPGTIVGIVVNLDKPLAARPIYDGMSTDDIDTLLFEEDIPF